MGGTCTPQNLPVGKLSSQDQTGYPLSSPRPRATVHRYFLTWLSPLLDDKRGKDFLFVSSHQTP